MTEQADKAAIRGIIEGIDKALHDRDAEGVVAGFAADALLFDLAPPLSRKIKVEDVAAWINTWEGPVTRRRMTFRSQSTASLLSRTDTFAPAP